MIRNTCSTHSATIASLAALSPAAACAGTDVVAGSELTATRICNSRISIGMRLSCPRFLQGLLDREIPIREFHRLDDDTVLVGIQITDHPLFGNGMRDVPGAQRVSVFAHQDDVDIGRREFAVAE